MGGKFPLLGHSLSFLLALSGGLGTAASSVWQRSAQAAWPRSHSSSTPVAAWRTEPSWPGSRLRPLREIQLLPRDLNRLASVWLQAAFWVGRGTSSSRTGCGRTSPLCPKDTGIRAWKPAPWLVSLRFKIAGFFAIQIPRTSKSKHRPFKNTRLCASRPLA